MDKFFKAWFLGVAIIGLCSVLCTGFLTYKVVTWVTSGSAAADASTVVNGK